MFVALFTKRVFGDRHFGNVMHNLIVLEILFEEMFKEELELNWEKFIE